MSGPNTTYLFGDCEIQPDFNTVSRDGDMRQVSPRVMDVLVHLIKNSDRIVSANELLETFWTDRVVEESTIHRHISQIRTALGDSAKEAKYIKTVSKRGYQAVAPIKVRAAETTQAQAAAPLNKPDNGADQTNSTTDDAAPYAFISYSHQDSSVVYKEIKWLESQGVKIWYDKGISPGSNWLSMIGDSLLGASSVLFFVSERSLASDHCNREISLALDEGITIIPIYLDNAELTSDLKVGLSRVQALRLKEQGFRTQLLQTLTFINKDKPQTASTAPTKPKRPVKVIAAAVACALLITSVASFQWFISDSFFNTIINSMAETTESIAVLPFTNLSDRDSVGFFAKGLSDSILDELANIGHMKVASRTRTFQLAEQGVPLSDIAKQVGVDYVLEGSVQEQDGQLLITTQLIRASDGYHVMSQNYQRLFKDSFSAQRQISANISQMSHDKINLDQKHQFPERYEELKGIKPEAVELYLQGLDHYNNYRIGQGGDLTVAMQLMQSAVEIDPTFLHALSNILSDSVDRVNSRLSLEQSSENAHVALKKMQAQGATQEQMHIQIVLWTKLDLDYASAAEVLEEAIVVAPQTTWIRTLLAQIAIREGRQQEGLALFRADAALQNVHDEYAFLPLYSRALMVAGKYSESLEVSNRALDLLQKGSPRATALLTKVDALLMLDRLDEALPLVDEAWRAAQGKNTEQFAQIFTRIGRPKRTKEVLQSAIVTPNNRLYFALGYESLGEIGTVFELIRDGIEDHDVSMLEVMRTNIWSDAVKQDPRFLNMLDLLESKETNTPKYLRAHDASSVQSS